MKRKQIWKEGDDQLVLYRCVVMVEFRYSGFKRALRVYGKVSFWLIVISKSFGFNN